ncbi:MAG: beta-ketoacyl-ACP synthase III [Candidatus Sericytochromatia bacterium]|nr:beta-ketoacyl-ACP synthase III [Candidatus Sericytochromatia bacterium]
MPAQPGSDPLPAGLHPVALTGVGAQLPTRVLSNDFFAARLDTSDAWIRSRTGIATRRVLAPEENLWELCLPAAREALSMAGVEPASLELIVVATSSPDHPMPSTAAWLQAHLGATRAVAFDMEAACSGFVFGLAVVSQFIRTGLYTRCLLVGADALSRFMDYEDRNTSILFGDGAGAVVVERGQVEGLHALKLATDGTRADQLVIAPDASPTDCVPRSRPQSFMRMNGREIYKFVLDTVPDQIREVCHMAGCELDDIDAFLLHQANQRILEGVATRLGVPLERVPSHLSRYGNTSAASIPIVLAEEVGAGRIKRGDTLCLSGFGAGLTWGSAIADWNGPA